MAYHSKYSGAEVDALLDKIKDGDVGRIDSSLSTTSENPVQNKVITEELNKKANKTNIATINGQPLTNGGNIKVVTEAYDDTVLRDMIERKVDKVEGKQLSTEDFTSELKGKLDGLTNYDDTKLKGDLEVIKGRVDEKQDYIADLASIRDGASKGSTALQEHQDISHLLPKSDFETYASETDTKLTELSLEVGDLSQLQTTEKSNLVGAINEVKQGGGGGGIPDAPSDGKTYGRKDGAWSEVQGGGDDTLTRIALGTAGTYVRELTDGHIDVIQDTITQNNTWNNANIKRILSGSLGDKTSMSYVFYSCTNLETIEPSIIIGKNCTQMQSTFQENSKLEKVDLSYADLSNCTSMQNVFDNCSSLISIGTSTLTLTSVTNLNSAFNGVKLQRLKIVGGNACTTIQNCFRNCTLLKELDLSEFDASSLTNCKYIILNAPNVETLIGSHTLEEVERGEVVCFNNISCDFPLAEFNAGGKLGRATLLAIIKGLKDLSGGDSKTLTLGSTLRAKLTAEDIAIATSKNWLIS